MNYKAGTASVCITPDEPLWLAGYAARTAPAHGKSSDLYASALALEDDNGQRFVIASMDIIAIAPSIADPVLDAISDRHALARRQVLLAPTHTHYGPEYRTEKQLFFNIPPEFGAKLPAVAAKLVVALVQVIEQALARLEPVRLLVRKTTAGFAHNRRRHGVKEGRPSTEDLLDHDVPALDCVDASGKRKAIVFGYACHNTTIPLDDLRYCGDWAGFACQELREANPGATVLFIPGAGADQDPEPRGSVELSQQYGHEIAQAIRQSLDEPGVEINGPIRSEWEDVPLALEPVTTNSLQEMLLSNDPPKRVKARFLLDALDRGEEQITSYPAPVQVVRFGNEMLMIALSGEPVVDWAHKFKRGAWSMEHGVGTLTSRSPPGTLWVAPSFPLVWVAGYCNDLFGYVPTRRIQTEGGYEAGRATLWSEIPTPFTEDVEDQITAAVRRLLARVSD